MDDRGWCSEQKQGICRSLTRDTIDLMVFSAIFESRPVVGSSQMSKFGNVCAVAGMETSRFQIINIMRLQALGTTTWQVRQTTRETRGDVPQAPMPRTTDAFHRHLAELPFYHHLLSPPAGVVSTTIPKIPSNSAPVDGAPWLATGWTIPEIPINPTFP